MGLGEGRTLHRVRKGRVKVVDDLGEAGRGLLVASFVQHKDLDVPGLHWVSLHLRGLVTERQKSAFIEASVSPVPGKSTKVRNSGGRTCYAVP